jgi:hypothetical protein
MTSKRRSFLITLLVCSLAFVGVIVVLVASLFFNIPD